MTNQYLSDKEVKQYILQSQQGDESAREILVQKNTRLVWSNVQRFINRGYDPQDLFQIGCIGLLKCIDKFNVEFDVKFSTYAVPMIIGEIQRFIRDDGTIKVSRGLKELANKIRYGYYREFSEYPTLEKIVELYDVTLDMAREALSIAKGHGNAKSIDEVVFENDGDPITIADQLDGDVNGNWHDNFVLKEGIKKLEEREQEIVRMRYYEDRTQSEVAKEMGISQVQVSRLEKQILNKIKQLTKEDNSMANYTGNREEAIRLAKTTILNYKEISERTGVPYSTVAKLVIDHRPRKLAEKAAEQTKSNRQKAMKKALDAKRQKEKHRKAKEQPKVVKEVKFKSVEKPKSNPTLSMPSAKKEAASALDVQKYARQVDEAKLETMTTPSIEEAIGKQFPDIVEQPKQEPVEAIQQVEQEARQEVEKQVQGITTSFNYNVKGSKVTKKEATDRLNLALKMLEVIGEEDAVDFELVIKG